jgi:hypothetical protein
MIVKKSMKDKTNLFRNCLYQVFAGEDYNERQIQSFIGHFDSLTGTGMSNATALEIVYSSYGGKSPERVCTTINEFISSQIAKQAANHDKLEQNSAKRCVSTIERFNKNVDMLKGIEIDGVSLSGEELENLKIKMPAFVKSVQTFNSTASVQGKKNTNLEIEIRFLR